MISRYRTKCCKGFFAILIVLFHLSQHIDRGLIFDIIGDSGYLSVAIFFFISGYGIFSGYKKYGGGYFDHFLIRRLSKVLIPWLIVSVIYFVYYVCSGSVDLAIKNLTYYKNGCLLITNSWFVIVIVAFYFIFYIVFRRDKISDKKGILNIFLAVTVFIIFLYTMGMGKWWWYSSYGFFIGVLYKYKEEQIHKKKLQVLIISILTFFCCYICRGINVIIFHSEILYCIACLVASAIFCLIVFCGLHHVHFENKIWAFMGDISYEIYLLHELIYIILRKYIKSDFLYVFATIIITLIVAMLLNTYIHSKISLLLQKIEN